MQQFFEFIGNHPLLAGLFAIVLAAWIAYEVSRLMRKWSELDTLAAVRLINRDETLVLDVSNSTDYAKGHIVGAQNLPPSRIESGNKELLKAKDRPVLVYCKNGQVSPQMAGRLVKLGFSDVYVLAGGLAQWISDQQPVSRQKGAAKKKDKQPRKKKAKKAQESKETSED
jgi:rhodanese-related sulfurtransferase